MNGRKMALPHRVAEYWIAQPGQKFVVDLGEPSCFACGWWCQAAPNHPRVTIATAWRLSRLERAHLTPHALGGCGKPENLVMLCTTCHAEAPDWLDPDVMLTWVRNRESWLHRRLGEVEREWQALTPEPFDVPRGMDIGEWMQNFKVALSANGSTHGTALSPATIALALRKASQ